MRHIWWFLVPALLSLVAPAQARPRDDALSGAIRCGAIADSRQWLDCYYGAAQPMRAALGLAPALKAQVQLAASPPAGGQPRDEGVRAEVVSSAAGCMREPGDRPWLDCYYAAATPMRVQLGLSAPQAAIKPPAPVPAPQLAYVAPVPAPKPAGPPPMPRKGTLFGGLFNTPKPIVRDMPMASYVLGLWRMQFDCLLLFIPGSSVPFFKQAVPWWFGSYFMYPAFLMGIYLMHFACWSLGAMYRLHHDQFPWVMQRHIRMHDDLRMRQQGTKERNLNANSAKVKAAQSRAATPPR